MDILSTWMPPLGYVLCVPTMGRHGFVARIAQRDLTPVELIGHGLDIMNPGSQR